MKANIIVRLPSFCFHSPTELLEVEQQKNTLEHEDQSVNGREPMPIIQTSLVQHLASPWVFAWYPTHHRFLLKPMSSLRRLFEGNTHSRKNVQIRWQLAQWLNTYCGNQGILCSNASQFMGLTLIAYEWSVVGKFKILNHISIVLGKFKILNHSTINHMLLNLLLMEIRNLYTHL